LPRQLEIAGALVTIDAIGTQVEIAETILDKGADYLLALKSLPPTRSGANRPVLLGEVERFFADPHALVERFETVDAGHDRIESRRAAVTHDIDWLWSDRRYPDEPRFPGLASLIMVEAEVERDGRRSLARRHFLSSARLDAATRAHAVRAHWAIENNPHWVLDVVFRDDHARVHTGHGPENIAVVKHMALNTLTNDNATTSIKNKRKLAGWNTGYLEKLLRSAA